MEKTLTLIDEYNRERTGSTSFTIFWKMNIDESRWHCGNEPCNGSICVFAVFSCFSVLTCFFLFSKLNETGWWWCGNKPGNGSLVFALFLIPPLETSPWEDFHAISNLTARPKMWCKLAVFHSNRQSIALLGGEDGPKMGQFANMLNHQVRKIGMYVGPGSEIMEVNERKE